MDNGVNSTACIFLVLVTAMEKQILADWQNTMLKVGA